MDHWENDAQQMVASGISCVRIGEFAWSLLQPKPEQYEWQWLDHAIECLAQAGLKIILGTPTAAPPKWLVDQHPEILAVDENGHPRRFGSRRHYCFASQHYRHECRQITTLMVQRYGKHPAIIAWQIDNEYGCHDTVLSYSNSAKSAFQNWLKQRYTTIEKLNQAWGNVFWSQEYDAFIDIDPPIQTVTEANPCHQLDYQRFASDMVVEFNQEQVKIIRTYAPQCQLLHNYMGFYTGFDHFKVGQNLDIATWDSYPLGFLDQGWFSESEKCAYLRVGHPDFAGFHHDLYRAVGKGKMWVMEQQPGPVNWAPNNPAPREGMVRLWTWEAFAHGAEVVSYFRWRQAPFAQEQMHGALHLPNGQVTYALQEVKQVFQELKRLKLNTNQAHTKAELALIFDYESAWVLDIQPQGEEICYLQILYEFYSSLRELGVSIDIISPCSLTDLPYINDYKAIITPCQPIINDTLHTALSTFKGHVLLGPRTGSKTQDYQIPMELPPGSLQALIDLKVTQVESLRSGIQEAVYQNNHCVGHIIHWREFVDSAIQPLLQDQEGYGCLFRQGNIRYLTGWPDAPLRKFILQDVLASAGVSIYELPESVRLRRYGCYVFAFNYGAKTAHVLLPNATCIFGNVDILPSSMAIWHQK